MKRLLQVQVDHNDPNVSALASLFDGTARGVAYLLLGAEIDADLVRVAKDHRFRSIDVFWILADSSKYDAVIARAAWCGLTVIDKSFLLEGDEVPKKYRIFDE